MPSAELAITPSSEKLPSDLAFCARLLAGLLPRSCCHVWMSPGNRCSPLVQALFAAEREGLCCIHTHFDERGMAFAALGAARASGLPVLLVCTSGSAVANLLPAMVEARAQGLRLVALTADRPSDEQGRGCPQTWPHLPLLQGAVVRSWSFPCPPADLEHELGELLSSLHHACGPLHVNLPFSEPFGIDRGSMCVALRAGADSRPLAPAHELPAGLERAWCEASRPLVTLGASWDGVSCKMLAALQERGALVLADVLSQHAFQGQAMRLTEATVAQLQHLLPADLWIHIGGPLVSRSLTRLMTQWRPLSWVISEHDLRWDPAHVEPTRWDLAPPQLTARIWEARGVAQADGAWPPSHFPPALAPASEEALPILEAFRTTPSHGIFFVGNSAPIRHLAEYAPPRPSPPRIWANRGVNGIDGNLATALGMAICQPRAVTAALGDLTTLHDLNSLALGHEALAPVRLLVVNNGGGGIFKGVAGGVPAETLRRGFITPHRWTFEGAAHQFGWRYSCAPEVPEEAKEPLLWEPRIARV